MKTSEAAVKVDLLNGKIFTPMLHFAVPILFSVLFQQLYNTIDTLIVGHTLGETALAAMGAAVPVYDLMIGFALGFGNGLSIVTARFFGAGDERRLKDSVAASVVIGLAVVAVLTALSQVMMFPLLNLMNMKYYSLFRLNSLAIEPSHAARLLTVYFYAFIKLLEFKDGIAPSIKKLWGEHRRVIIAFLYAMVAMGSGTAFVGLAILSLYFIKRQYAVYVVVFASVFLYSSTVCQL